jgi:hypothetical protein
MKTSVELDQDKIMLAKALTSEPTIKGVLDLALDVLIKQYKRKSLAAILGTQFFDGNLDRMRERQLSENKENNTPKKRR